MHEHHSNCRGYRTFWYKYGLNFVLSFFVPAGMSVAGKG